MSEYENKWVAVVYDGLDKVGSHYFHGNDEEEVRVIAQKWVDSNFGEGRDWSLHRMSSYRE